MSAYGFCSTIKHVQKERRNGSCASIWIISPAFQNLFWPWMTVKSEVVVCSTVTEVLRIENGGHTHSGPKTSVDAKWMQQQPKQDVINTSVKTEEIERLRDSCRLFLLHQHHPKPLLRFSRPLYLYEAPRTHLLSNQLGYKTLEPNMSQTIISPTVFEDHWISPIMHVSCNPSLYLPHVTS